MVPACNSLVSCRLWIGFDHRTVVFPDVRERAARLATKISYLLVTVVNSCHRHRAAFRLYARRVNCLAFIQYDDCCQRSCRIVAAIELSAGCLCSVLDRMPNRSHYIWVCRQCNTAPVAATLPATLPVTSDRDQKRRAGFSSLNVTPKTLFA